MRNQEPGSIAALDRFLDVVDGMWEGPLDHFTCTEATALADLMATHRGEHAGRSVIIHHLYGEDEEDDELREHLKDWPGLAEELRQVFSEDAEVIELLDDIEREEQK
jgi:hypothetical protein